MYLVDRSGNAFGTRDLPDGIGGRLAAAALEVDRLAGSGAAHRALAEFGSVVAVDMGVPYPWAVRVCCWAAAVAEPDVSRALDWAVRRAPHGHRLVAPTAEGPWDRAGLVVRDRLPAFALSAGHASEMHRPAPRGLEIGPPDGLDELHEGYGGWMADPELARGLVVAEDLARPERGFLVARADGAVVGCALVWWVAGTAYLSGLGVVAEHRGLGYGSALTVAAAQLGAAGPPGGTAPDLVWMHATPEGAAVYARLGFVPAGEEVQLGPAGGP